MVTTTYEQAIKELNDSCAASLAIIPDSSLTPEQLVLRTKARINREENTKKMVAMYCDHGEHNIVCTHYHKREYACEYCGKVIE